MNTKQTILSTSAILAIFAATTTISHAANGSIIASGTFTFASDPVSGFDYTVTVLNSASSTASISTFWLGWTFSGDFLPSDPTSLAGPTGWTGSVVAESGKFSAQYLLGSGSAIAPGGSGIFTFTSADSPSVMSGNQTTAPLGPTASSFVFNGGAFSTPSDGFTVTEAPEPSSLGLIALGGLGFAALGWRKKFFHNA